MPALVQVSCDELLATTDETGLAVSAAFRKDSFQLSEGNFEMEIHLLGIGVGGSTILQLGDELHDLDRAHTEGIELPEDKIVEDDPREVRSFNDLFEFLGVLIFLHDAPAQGTMTSDQLVDKDLLEAAGADDMMCIHPNSHENSFYSTRPVYSLNVISGDNLISRRDCVW